MGQNRAWLRRIFTDQPLLDLLDALVEERGRVAAAEALSTVYVGGAIGALIRERPYKVLSVPADEAPLIVPSCPLHQSTHSFPTLLLPTILLACYGERWESLEQEVR